ncbi:PDC sensor domain-containing protein [Corallococcus macrosporus]|uniref:PDC sensor domain-containing protein n=1 Tax=Corallococcus macrosporus TaxID=35 RepID=A0ABS3DNY4_9BACT|nr:PDC sensor domain-containing protein [Corallococcus macrosporus]MBN8233050.1 PDC sensor domain-containing protein [Corallococcus macrosporus]
MSMVWLGLALTVGGQLPPDGVAQLRKVDGVMPHLRRLAEDPEVVRAIRAQNALRTPLATLQQHDAEWMATPALTPFKQRVLDGPCKGALHRLRERLGPALAEAFTMDGQGALVCASRRTSDYWQGDEDKWRLTYAEGRGGPVLREAPFFDESSQAYVIQVSLPVRDGAQVIGALTVGLSLLDL